jgi:hypothetical protein
MASAAGSDAYAISDISDVPDKKHIFCGTHSESVLELYSRVLDFCIFYFIFLGRMSTPLNAPPEYIHYLH